MKKLAYKIGLGVVGGGVATMLMASSAFAAGNVNATIRGNGAHSRNRIRIRISGSGGGICRRRCRPARPTVQKNFARITNVVHAGANTGFNSANKNTQGNGGDVTVKTGKATVRVTIDTTFNQNN